MAEIVSANDNYVTCNIRLSKKNEVSNLSDEEIKAASDRYNDPNDQKLKIVGYQASIYKTDLEPSDDTLKKAHTAAVSKSGIDPSNVFNQQSVSDFMNDSESGKGNVIVKSFRSAGGKGLAGFIESMDFDWYDRVTWEIDPNKRAPKMCKITVSFSPVHDIAPGLDHEGSNRAPIYPIGPLYAKGR